jgi:hypothetical protein
MTKTLIQGCMTNFPFHSSNFANTNSPCPTDIPLFEKKRGKMQNTAMQKHQERNLSYTLIQPYFLSSSLKYDSNFSILGTITNWQ